MRKKIVALMEIVLMVSAVFLAFACGVRLSPPQDAWYVQHYIIMQDFERNIYADLSPEAKVQFQNHFWAFRSPAAKAEFETRVSYTMTAFKKENSQQPWNTDRSRIYILNGSPASIDYKQDDAWADQVIKETRITPDHSNEDIGTRLEEVWTYAYRKHQVYYAFTFRKPAEWRLVEQMRGNQFRDELEARSREEDYRISDLEAYKAELEKLKK